MPRGRNDHLAEWIESRIPGLTVTWVAAEPIPGTTTLRWGGNLPDGIAIEGCVALGVVGSQPRSELTVSITDFPPRDRSQEVFDVAP